MYCCHHCSLPFPTARSRGSHVRNCKLAGGGVTNETSLTTNSSDDENVSVDGQADYDHCGDMDDFVADETESVDSDDPNYVDDGDDIPRVLRAFDLDDDMMYCRLQENLYASIFNLESLQDSHDINSFLGNMPHYAEEDVTMAKLLHFRKKAKLSRTSGKKLLTLLKAMNPSLSIPDDWRSVTRHVTTKCSFLDANTIRHIEPWPAHWCMDRWSQRMLAPEPREIICRDPLELLCLKCVDPTLQFINGGDIQYSYVEETLHDGTPCASNLMSSQWAKQTESEIKAIHPDGILFPLVVYADGVSLGLRNKVRRSPMSCTSYVL